MKPEWDAYHIAITKTHIKSEEGYKLEAYKCTEGYLTGGYGHRIMDGEAIPSTKKGWVEIFDMLANWNVPYATTDKISPVAAPLAKTTLVPDVAVKSALASFTPFKYTSTNGES